MLKKSSGHSGKCYNCGVQGHFVKNCPSLKKKRDSSLQQDTKKDSQSGDQDKNKVPGSTTTRGLFLTIETSMFMGESPITRHCFIDMAALGIFVPRIKDLHNFKPFSHPRLFMVVNGGEVTSCGMGIIKMAVRGSISLTYHMFNGCQIYIHTYFPLAN